MRLFTEFHRMRGTRHTMLYTYLVGRSADSNLSSIIISVSRSRCLQWMRSPTASYFTHTHTHAFNGPLSGTTRVSLYQKGKTNLDFTEARDSEWQWHQLGHMQVCTSLQTDNHTSTPPLSFYRPDVLPATQPTASKH